LWLLQKHLLLVWVLLLPSAAILIQEFALGKADAAAGDGHMLLFWDGGAAPTGWSCVSCLPGDDFYQTFIRANETYGGTGGSLTHTHTVTEVVNVGIGTASRQANGNVISDATHTHTATTNIGTASNLPLYRQLKIIRRDINGQPSIIPSGAIGLFDAAVPTGWTRYSAQDGYYTYGENIVGTTGGSNAHNHTITGTLNAATGSTQGQISFLGQPSAAAGHTHTYSGNTSTVNNEPPYIETIFGQADSDTAPPVGMLAMWDDDVPTNWTVQSDSSGSFYQRFIKAAASFGATGGSATSSHADQTITSSGASASLSSFFGNVTASTAHTHDVDLNDYSVENHIPPYRDVILAKKVPETSTNQSAYRFYKNINSTDVGAPLALQNTIAPSPKQGRTFRLRILISVTDADLDVGNKSFKLQYATRSGTCDNAFSGETYVDVTTSSGDIRYADNSSPSDGANATANVNDPDIGNTVITQTYEEANNVTSTSSIADGEDGMWDFSLVDFSAPASTSYCLRVVFSDGSTLDNYDQIASLITDNGEGHMLLYFDGATIPTGWECISCTSQDDFYQRFARGESTYGATGGSASHNHTGDGAIGASNSNTISNISGTSIATLDHTHTFDPIFSSESILPNYRQLKVIRAETSGVPTTLPTGSIALFDAAVPTGWTRYAAQDGFYVRGEGTAGTTGGSNTHSHSVTGITGGSVNELDATGGFFGTVAAAVSGHTHSVSTTSDTINHEPPYLNVILGQLNAAAAAPLNIITMWDESPPGSWTRMSDNGGPLYQRFIKPAASYGGAGGTATHTHTDINATTSGPSSTTQKQGGGTNAGGGHTHPATVTNITAESNLPPYIEVIYAKLGQLNTAPNAPSSLDQKRTSDDSSITIGGYSNGGQVKFVADASDPDNPDSLQLCVEVELIGTAFNNVATRCGNSVVYSGGTVQLAVTVSGLASGSSYHWQVQIKDGGGSTSAWVSFGANPESATDFIDDTTAPSGSVYDGTVIGVDNDYNNGDLDELSANWSITDTGSGIDKYEYSIGTSAGGTDIISWTDVGIDTDVTVTSLSLRTTVTYYVNVRATDNAGNQGTETTDGQLVAPTLSFSTSPGNVTFDNLNSGNSYTSTKTTTLTTSTNAHQGYVIRAFATGLLTSPSSDTVGFFDGGTYAAPDEWLPGDTGYGYTSNDNDIQGVNKFNPVTCDGGGLPPCYAPFSTSAPGDIVADNTSLVTGAPIVNENFIITHRVTTDAIQEAGKYTSEVTYVVNAVY
jgi:hypothetical protein